MFGTLGSPLARRLTLLFLAASVLPLVGAGMLTLASLRSSVERDARRQQAVLAETVGRLVRLWITRSNDKLATMARLLERNPIEADLLAQRAAQPMLVNQLERLVDPPDAFLEVQHYVKNPGVPVQLLAQAGQQRITDVQQALPNAKQQRLQEFNENIGSPAVQAPLKGKKNFNSMEPQTVLGGFRSLPISTRVEGSKGASAALVGYLDLARLDALLASASGENRHVVVRNKTGKVIAEAGAPIAEAFVLDAPVGYGNWRVHLQAPATELDAAFASTRSRVLTWVALAAAFAVLASMLFATWILRPVRQLTASAERLQAGDFSTRSEIRRSDEIGSLGQTFDRMAAALERLDEAKSSFIGTVSHELRTPLTSMRLSIENLCDGVLGPIDEKQQRSLVRIRADVDRLIRMVSELLELARLEAGVESPERAASDLHRIASSCCERAQGLAVERGVTLRAEGSGSARIDAGILERILSNLIENAIRHGPEKGLVRVVVADDEVSVIDQGGGFDGELMFEPFAQGRDGGRKKPGVGLGLTIVRKLAKLQDAEVLVEAGPDGNAVRLRFASGQEGVQA